jgi:chromate transporter
MLTVLMLAFTYDRYGTTPEALWLLWGVKPVAISIIDVALGKLGKRVLKGLLSISVAVLMIPVYFLQVDPLLLLLTGGLLVMIISNWHRVRSEGLLAFLLVALNPTIDTLSVQPFTLSALFFTLLKIGAVLYGGGYVLPAFLQAEFVQRLGWLSSQQLIDAVAIGQLTPGPVFTTATFIGYILGGGNRCVVNYSRHLFTLVFLCSDQQPSRPSNPGVNMG